MKISNPKAPFDRSEIIFAPINDIVAKVFEFYSKNNKEIPSDTDFNSFCLTRPTRKHILKFDVEDLISDLNILGITSYSFYKEPVSVISEIYLKNGYIRVIENDETKDMDINEFHNFVFHVIDIDYIGFPYKDLSTFYIKGKITNFYNLFVHRRN